MMKLSLFIATMLLSLQALALSDTINVPADYPTIQEAIDAAMEGDTVLVAYGVYEENIDFKGKAITVKSEPGYYLAAIIGNWPSHPDFGSVVTFKNNEGPDAVLERIILLDGTGTFHQRATSSNGSYCGGGIFCLGSSPTIRNCELYFNTADLGGGIYIEDSSPMLIECLFKGNAASGNNGAGGGVAIYELSSPTLQDCSYKGNFALSGGGIFNWEADMLTITGCTFLKNMAIVGGGINNTSNMELFDCTFEQNLSVGKGGGIYNSVHGVLNKCTFLSNSASSGGGICNFNNSFSKIEGCIFIGNIADYNGGGVDNWGDTKTRFEGCIFENNQAYRGGAVSNVNYASTEFNNCMFIHNLATLGGGLYNSVDEETTSLTNCSFFGNSAILEGGGINNIYSALILTNCVLWGDTAGSAHEPS
ncbi:MAG: right-handed parallel beta-helix repeat-containing protein, partial [Planctomycetota bacterium]